MEVEDALKLVLYWFFEILMRGLGLFFFRFFFDSRGAGSEGYIHVRLKTSHFLGKLLCHHHK